MECELYYVLHKKLLEYLTGQEILPNHGQEQRINRGKIIHCQNSPHNSLISSEPLMALPDQSSNENTIFS